MTNISRRKIFIAGGTGYIGAPLIDALVARGHEVRALVREATLARAAKQLPPACELAPGDALDAGTFSARVSGCDTFVQMVGVPHPSPRKAGEFRNIDLCAAVAGLDAACSQRVAHFVYLSVTQFAGHRAPAMHAYVASRATAEARISAEVARGKLAASFLRPWYVLGPGHRWPLLLKPLYALASRVPALRANAQAMGLVTREDMIAALVFAIENPPAVAQVAGLYSVPRICELGRQVEFSP